MTAIKIIGNIENGLAGEIYCRLQGDFMIKFLDTDSGFYLPDNEIRNDLKAAEKIARQFADGII